MQTAQKIKKIIKESYGRVAQLSSSCGCKSCSCDSSQTIQKQAKKFGYTETQIKQVPSGANLGLGCGNPVAISSLKVGEVVLDLGSGAGFDTFLAAAKVGKTGKVIGVDMTDEMLKKAKENAQKANFTNVEFRKGDIENLPVKDNSIDVIISNCVINLAPDKKRVFQEAYRVLKPGGRLTISDVVLQRPLPKNLKKDKKLLVGCISGAILKQDYLKLLKKVGFSDFTIHQETPAFLKSYALSITFSAFKR